eukprot:TRINITY_DN9637_c0_g1_i1.p1 TRINITY_DN9637_c0_g1~~TRINITY_DN9637_c0_g1_i1.p1  ORF type:complete len:519 (-),score=112.25 TRINITY_DN9637_c0_g1_i1:6-1562(-)
MTMDVGAPLEAQRDMVCEIFRSAKRPGGELTLGSLLQAYDTTIAKRGVCASDLTGIQVYRSLLQWGREQAPAPLVTAAPPQLWLDAVPDCGLSGSLVAVAAGGCEGDLDLRTAGGVRRFDRSAPLAPTPAPTTLAELEPPAVLRPPATEPLAAGLPTAAGLPPAAGLPTAGLPTAGPPAAGLSAARLPESLAATALATTAPAEATASLAGALPTAEPCRSASGLADVAQHRFHSADFGAGRHHLAVGAGDSAVSASPPRPVPTPCAPPAPLTQAPRPAGTHESGARRWEDLPAMPLALSGPAAGESSTLVQAVPRPRRPEPQLSTPQPPAPSLPSAPPPSATALAPDAASLVPMTMGATQRPPPLPPSRPSSNGSAAAAVAAADPAPATPSVLPPPGGGPGVAQSGLGDDSADACLEAAGAEEEFCLASTAALLAVEPLAWPRTSGHHDNLGQTLQMPGHAAASTPHAAASPAPAAEAMSLPGDLQEGLALWRPWYPEAAWTPLPSATAMSATPVPSP